MDDNIIEINNNTIIMNGGNPLEGCPKNWEEANQIELEFNKGVQKEDDEYNDVPRWSFDCGFKLDYDGSLIKISSRFYPPKTHYGATWDGTVDVYFMGKELSEKKFDCPTLDELKKQVEDYVQTIIYRLESALK